MGKGFSTETSVLYPVLRIDEAAARLGCPAMDIWALIHQGRCPGLRRLWGRLVIDADRLDEVLDVLTRPVTVNEPC